MTTTIANGESGLSVRNKLNDIWAGLQLNEIAASKAVTAVDVFVYDTSKDSDGGAWRKRTQHTSWYNETLNTATRGSRREFPAVAVIVAESDKVTIYDGDDPDLPMWKTLSQVVGTLPQVWRGGYNATCISAKNGIVAFGVNVGSDLVTNGLVFVDLLSDTFGRYGENASHTGKAGPVTEFESTTLTLDLSGGLLVDGRINDVAMTVLPDAPIDPATGLPVPTIAVATAGGVSVIKDDGTVVDITAASGNIWSGVSFASSGRLSAYHKSVKDLVTLEIPSTDYVYTSGSSHLLYNELSDPPVFNTSGYNSSGPTGDILPTVAGDSIAMSRRETPSAGEGVSLLSENPTTQSGGMVAYTTSTYNTGWMNGDIKGAFLSDTDDTDLVGSGELVTNGTFDTDLTGWTLSASTPPTWNAAGTIQFNSDGVTFSDADQSFSTTIGATYVLSLEQVNVAGTTELRVGTAQGGSQNISTTISTLGVQTFTFVATSTTTWLRLRDGASSTNQQFDNISLKLADADRSVNNNGLIVNGTVTRTAVATGADLVAYSGFSASNYLEQPYNSDLDFGTGDFCVMGWVKQDSTNAFRAFANRVNAASPTAGWQFLLSTDDTPYFYNYTAASGTTTSGIPMPTNSWGLVGVKRSGTIVEVFLNGRTISSATIGATVSGSYPLNIGSRQGDIPATGCSLALWRISATAPTAEQIKKIYEDEKFLFQDNAQATLYGASDAVTALAHDPVTDLLHVGTSAGRSVFSGLRRVSNTTTAVGTAISAQAGLVAEE